MILMYHKVHPNSPTIWWIKVNDFYRQMSELQSKEVVYLDAYEIGNPNQVVITFDGIYKNVLEYALPILKHFNYPFELFLTSDYIGLNNEFDTAEPIAEFATVSELQALVAGGGRLQWHTKSHPDMQNMEDPEAIRNELKTPEVLLKIDANGFNWFAYPYGNCNETVIQEVQKRFKGAVSCYQGNDHDIYKLNRLTVYSDTALRNSKIACIIASYNYGDYLIEAVESVLRQTILPNEILISDDCSDDETQIIAQAYAAKYPGLISYNRNKANMGVVAHFNKAISLTKSDYVFFLGADNRILSNYIEASAAILDQHANIAIAYTDYAFFGSRAKLAYSNFPEDRKGGIIANTFYQVCFPCFDNRNDLVTALNEGNFIHGSSMFKRIAFDEVGGYLNTNSAEDYNLFKRIVAKGWDAQKVTATNLEYRQHSSGQVNNLVSLHNKLSFYKNLYLERKTFESSKFYKIALALFKIRKRFKKMLRKILK